MKKYMRARYWQEKAQDRHWKTAAKNMIRTLEGGEI